MSTILQKPYGAELISPLTQHLQLILAAARRNIVFKLIGSEAVDASNEHAVEYIVAI